MNTNIKIYAVGDVDWVAASSTEKELLLENVSELMVLADQLLLMEEYQDRLNGSNMKEALEGITNIIEESLL